MNSLPSRNLRSMRILYFAFGLVLQTSPAYADAVEDMFAAALAHKQNNRIDEAVASFKTITLEHPEHALAERAAHEYFEALRPKLEAPGYAVADDAAQVAARFIDGFCKTSANPTACEHFQAVHCSIVRLGAERRIKDNKSETETERAIERQAGDLYLSIWKRYGTNASTRNACRPDEALYNAAYAYRYAGDQQAAVTTYEILVDPQNGFLQSPLAHRALYELAQWHTLVAAFPEAIARFEQLATLAPKDQRAEDALFNAMVLRLQTGSVKEALKAAEKRLGLYSPTRKMEATTMILEVGETLIARGELHEGLAWLKRSMKRVQQDGSFEQKLVAAGWLGQALAGTGDQKGASEQYKGIFASATSGGWLRSEPTEKDGPMYVTSAWAWKALDVVVDAAVFMIRTQVTDAPRIPTGKSTQALQEAINARTTAMERAVERYGKPLDELRKPPTKWKAALSGVTGSLWIDLAEELEREMDSMKRKKARPDELRAFEKTAESAMNRAKGYAQRCLQQAVDAQQWSDDAKRCQRWLERRYPKEHLAVEEFVPGLRAPLESAVVREAAALANP